MEMYHLLNRGVDKRKIVNNDADRYRFMRDLCVLNDENAAPQNPHRCDIKNENAFLRTRKPLVYIHAYCLMDNHYHILVSEKSTCGISRFMQKLNQGYSRYFNEKYGRTGTLWQGKYKKILIEKDAHYMYIPFYIHLNALDNEMNEWRKGAVQNVSKALKILQKYRWSSHLDYSGTKNYPSIITRGVVGGLLGTPATYHNEIKRLITNQEISLSKIPID